MVSIFVFGLMAGDAGKTVVASAIARGLVRRGFDVGVFKACSEHDLWYDYDVYLKCKSEGRIFCEDIVKLHRAAMLSDIPYEVTNPVDTLEVLRSAEGTASSKVLIERYTIFKRGAFNVLTVNSSLASRSLDPEFISKLREYAAKIIGFNDDKQFKRVRDSIAPNAIESCYRALKERYGHIVVEGYKDKVCPSPSLSFDVVVGVAPGLAVIFDAKSFKASVNARVRQGVPAGDIKAGDIEPQLERDSLIKLPPLPSSKISDYEKVAEEFSPLVDVVAKEVERLNF